MKIVHGSRQIYGLIKNKKRSHVDRQRRHAHSHMDDMCNPGCRHKVKIVVHIWNNNISSEMPTSFYESITFNFFFSASARNEKRILKKKISFLFSLMLSNECACDWTWILPAQQTKWNVHWNLSRKLSLSVCSFSWIENSLDLNRIWNITNMFTVAVAAAQFGAANGQSNLHSVCVRMFDKKNNRIC